MVKRPSMIRAFSSAAARYDEHAVIAHNVAQRLVERLDYIKLEPQRILDLGCGTGMISELIAERYPQAEIISIDYSPAMLQQLTEKNIATNYAACADATQLPLADASIDLIVSNLLLPWVDDIAALFAECYRLLKPQGFCLWSALGPDTLFELAHSWQQVDAAAHVNQFIDLHTLGDQLSRQHFIDLVVDVDVIEVVYQQLDDLFVDLKSTGSHCIHPQKYRGLMTTKRLQALKKAYKNYQHDDGQMPATFEINYASAWKPKIDPQRRTQSGDVAVPISAIQGLHS